jgi:hypothetical protein
MPPHESPRSSYRPLATPKPQPAQPPPPGRVKRWASRLYASYLVVRGVLLVASTAAVFVVVTAVSGAWIEGLWARVTLGLAVALLLPLLVRARLRRAVARRTGSRAALGGPWFVIGCNALLLAGLCLGFSDAVGRSLRRRGDWFLGEVDGPLPRRYRGLVTRVSGWLERFDLPPEARPLLAEAAVAQIAHKPIQGGTLPPPPRPAARWVHPLFGPQRALPPNAACRFGAARPGPRPPECELGHCGIDLVQPEGSPVHAVHDGMVLRVQRDELAGGIAGRFVILTHRDGTVQSYYVHLQEIRTDLKAGMPVRAGEVIATLGRTGARRSGPHLHFALAVRRGSGQLYIDPEPLVRQWELPARPGPLVASRASGL